MSLYMNRGRIAPLCDTPSQADAYLTERGATSISGLLIFARHNRAVQPVLELALKMVEQDTMATSILQDLIGRINS